MASRNGKRGSSALDSLMAGFAAGAAAFIIYAMPQAHFEHAVALSGLPLIVPAAQAPLGMTARAAVMIAAGIGSFVLVWLVLRALSKPAARKEIRSGPVESEMAPPRLRRADMHPDAPSRRPILAGVDLGPSFDALSADFSESSDEKAFEENQLLPERELLDGSEAYREQPLEDLPEFHEQADDERLIESEEASHLQEVSQDNQAEAESASFAGEYGEEASDGVSNEADPEEELEERSLDLSSRHIDTAEAVAQGLPKADEGEAIPGLVQRLEVGLVRRRHGRGTTPAGQPANGVVGKSGSDHLDARLRGAIDELQKLASRGN